MDIKKLIRDHIRRLVDEKNYREQYLQNHPEESETHLYALISLAIQWNNFKIAFWSAVLNEQSGEREGEK